MNIEIAHKLKFLILIGIFVFGIGFFSGNASRDSISRGFHTNVASAGSGDNLSRWAWGENIGWISFNSTDCDSDSNGFIDSGNCGSDNSSIPSVNYGVSLDSSGNFSGFAWSPSVGWIRFDPENDGSVTCPSNNCRARVSDMSGAMSATTGQFEVIGFARACSVFASGCSGALNTNTGGWDGWISLNCSNSGGCGTSNYKIALDRNFGTPNYNHFVGFGWGSDVVGWVDFNPLCGATRCGVLFSSGVTLEVRNATLGSSWGNSLTIDSGNEVEVRADIQGSPTSCSATAPAGLGGTPNWGTVPPVSGTVYDGGIPTITPTRYTIVCDYSTGSVSAEAWVNINIGPQFVLTANPERYPATGVVNLPSNSVVDLGDITDLSVMPSGGFNSDVTLSLAGVYAGSATTDIRSYFNINITDNNLSFDSVSGSYEISNLLVRVNTNNLPRSNVYRIVLRGISGAMQNEITLFLYPSRSVIYQENNL